ncbi:MAG: nucleotide pyrophosphohydrolase [bacterium]|nr:nucleotide pyrophosphohydrolase [bacterium]
MSLSNYQKKVDKWANQYKTPYWQPHEILARITEETGELARLINHIYGPKKKKSSEDEQELGEELSDIIFAVVCMANSHDINLDEAFDRVIDKAYGRDNERYEKK